LLDGLDALTATGVDTGGRLVLVGGGARSPAFRAILAALAGRTVVVPDAAEHVATGACAQAAAALHGRGPADIAAAWGLGRGEAIEPDDDVDRYEIRARYRSTAG
jgi:xylulokinase